MESLVEMHHQLFCLLNHVCLLQTFPPFPPTEGKHDGTLGGKSWGKHKALKGYFYGGEIQHQGYYNVHMSTLRHTIFMPGDWSSYCTSWLLSHSLMVDSYVVLLLNHSTLSDSTFCGLLRCKIWYFTPFHYVLYVQHLNLPLPFA